MKRALFNVALVFGGWWLVVAIFDGAWWAWLGVLAVALLAEIIQRRRRSDKVHA